MDSKKLDDLIRRYFEGNTTPEEEDWLKIHFASGEIPEMPEVAIFQYLHHQKRDELGTGFDAEFLKSAVDTSPKPRKKHVILKYWYLAASLVLLLGLGITYRGLLFPEKPALLVQETDTWEDPVKAYNETRKILLIISSTLNQGEDYVAELSRFEHSQKTLKQE